MERLLTKGDYRRPADEGFEPWEVRRRVVKEV
jgi:hypothetical protein